MSPEEVARVREIARDLDAYSWTINDGYIATKAEQLLALIGDE